MAVAHSYQYLVETKSKFSLFLDSPNDDEPASISLPPKVESSPVEKESQPVQEKQRSQPAKPVRNERPVETVQRGRGRGNRGGVERGRGGFNKPRDMNIPMSEDIKRDDRPRGRGRGRGRGNGREFDRHSGSDKTGIKPVVKKDGHGTGNWGTVEDDIEATMSPVNEVADINGDSVEDVEETPVAPPEPESLTLEEYKARKSGVLLASSDRRAPNDGKDVFKNMVKRREPVKPQEVLEQPKNVSVEQTEDLNLQFELKFADSKPNNFRGGDRRPNRGRGGARGAGGARGGRNRGAPAGGRGGSNSNEFKAQTSGFRGGVVPPALNNDKDFPSLH